MIRLYRVVSVCPLTKPRMVIGIGIDPRLPQSFSVTDAIRVPPPGYRTTFSPATRSQTRANAYARLMRRRPNFGRHFVQTIDSEIDIITDEQFLQNEIDADKARRKEWKDNPGPKWYELVKPKRDDR